jgi:hypothetical protein
MDKQQADKIFTKVQKYYNSIPYPKYKNIALEEFKENYEALRSVKQYLESNALYNRLVNAMSQIITKREKQKQLVRLSDSEIWSNLSERGMNKVIPPLHEAKNKDVTFPVEWTDKWGNACYISNGFWDAKNYRVMDALGYMFLLKEGGDSLPEDADPIFQDLNAIVEREDQLSKDKKESHINQEVDSGSDMSIILNNAYSISFEDKDFRKNTGMDLSSSEILELLLETSRVEFKLSFPVRVKNTGNKENIHRMNFYSRFYELWEEEAKVRKDGIVQSRRYRVYFNTLLGELFVNNLKSRYNDKIDLRFYTLPDSAQIFYRRHLIHHSFSDLQIHLHTIAESVRYTDSNITNLIKTVESNILDPLREHGYFKSYERKKGLKGVKYIIYGICDREAKSSESEQKDTGSVK